MVDEVIDGYAFGRISPSNHRFPELQEVVYECYLAHGYIDNGQVETIDDQLVDVSTYFYAEELSSFRIVGGFRMISSDSSFGLPILDEFEIDSKICSEMMALPPEKLVEISRLAVAPGHRVSESLYRQGWQYSKRVGHLMWAISADERLWMLFRRFRGLHFRQAGPKKFYLGSHTVPGIATLSELEKSMSAYAPRFHEYMTGMKPNHLYSSR